MNLILLEKNKLTISPYAISIKEFSKIWERNKDKSTAIKELSYVYFMTDYKSVYNNYPVDIKDAKVREDIIRDELWKADIIIEEAIKKYEELQLTPTLRLLNAARQALEEMINYYKKVKFTDRNIIAASASMEKLGKISESFDKLEQKIKRELQMSGKTRADREINHYEE